MFSVFTVDLGFRFCGLYAARLLDFGVCSLGLLALDYIFGLSAGGFCRFRVCHEGLVRFSLRISLWDSGSVRLGSLALGLAFVVSSVGELRVLGP